ncbi:hypothetical protein B0T16DRAFT_495253 [Cercophora newfieldiana]|uniref:Uncharacterized protein n=1 Tax=Cercophora newfieldiana TaxID=92897 RepID=A0AA39Y1T6_9PEZI|nr:hypothetical protein B0T16DRAFT_495253 [Cercophora newfieldiana]
MAIVERTTPTQLLALGGLGAALLWVVAFLNGTLDNMNAAIAKGEFPDGRLLRSTFTGFGPIDGRIEYLVAFYEVLSNNTTLGPRLLFVNINFLIAATNIWVFVESRRRGVRNMALRHPVPFMLLWLGLGAAFIQPLYFWLHTRTKAVVRDPTVPHNEAIALFFAALPAFLLPLFLFVPPWLGMSTYSHHGYIGAFLGSPFLIVVACLSVVGLLIPWYGVVAKKDAKRPHVDKPWIVATFVLTGVLSAAVHLGCVYASLTSSNPDMSLARVFLPSPSKMHSFPSDPVTLGLAPDGTNTTLVSHLPAAYHTLYEGYHLFTQLDYAVVSAACVVFAHWMLHNRGGEKAVRGATMSSTEFRDMVLLVLVSLVIGPAAAGSFAFAAREKKIRETMLPNGVGNAHKRAVKTE